MPNLYTEAMRIGHESWLFESCHAREAESKWSNVRDFDDWLISLWARPREAGTHP